MSCRKVFLLWFVTLSRQAVNKALRFPKNGYLLPLFGSFRTNPRRLWRGRLAMSSSPGPLSSRPAFRARFSHAGFPTPSFPGRAFLGLRTPCCLAIRRMPTIGRCSLVFGRRVVRQMDYQAAADRFRLDQPHLDFLAESVPTAPAASDQAVVYLVVIVVIVR